MDEWTVILFGLIIVVAILGIVSWRQFWSEIEIEAKREHEQRLRKFKENADSGRNIVWLMHSYLPNVRAGAEITAHAVNTHLVKAGWSVTIVLPDWQVDELDGVKMVRYEKGSPICAQIFRNASAIFCQNYDTVKALQILEPYGKPVVFFMHIEREKRDVLQQRFKVPLAIVYNSITQKDNNPTIHEHTIVRPFIPFEKFKRREKDIPNGPVTLLNCNENKGGNLLVELAQRMRDVQFVGVRGAYSEQLSADLPNLRYVPLQEDPAPIFKAASIIIMPSKSESWGRVALEAMASGVPVIVSTAGGLRECTSGAAAGYCRFDDAGCWEEHIRRLLGDGYAYRQAIDAGQKRIENLQKAKDFEEFETWLTGRIAEWRAARELDNVY
jgi:glycosyltransferase involved in cell wall biosynthesis